MKICKYEAAAAASNPFFLASIMLRNPVSFAFLILADKIKSALSR
jgi:hypothetical protein